MSDRLAEIKSKHKNIGWEYCDEHCTKCWLIAEVEQLRIQLAEVEARIEAAKQEAREEAAVC